MIRIRNPLIHVYAKISPSIAYGLAKERGKRDILNIAGKIIKAAKAKDYDP